MIGDAKVTKDKLDNLDHRLLALENQGVRLPDSALAALIGRMQLVEAKVAELERKMIALEGGRSP